MIYNTAFLLTATGTLLVGVVIWRTHIPPPVTIDAAILLDRSQSMQSPCVDLPGTVERVLKILSTRPGSTFSVLVSGDVLSANQPVLLFDNLSVATQRVMRNQKRRLQDESDLIQKITAGCNSQPSPARTPIYLDIQQTLAHLHANDGAFVEKQLFVLSDLHETAEPRLNKALRQPVGARVPSPAPLNNAAINVVICGYAETRDRRHLAPTRIVEVWTRFFSNPDLVRFEPF